MKRKAIEFLLPEILRRTAKPGNPLFSLLEVMERLHAVPERRLQALDAIFDPRRTPPEFVPLLAGWVDLDWIFAPPVGHARTGKAGDVRFSPGMDRLRELVAASTRLASYRGTARGLLDFLRIATGASFEIDEHVRGPDGAPRLYHIRIRGPLETAPHRDLIERIIEFEKPAHVSYELEFSNG